MRLLLCIVSMENQFTEMFLWNIDRCNPTESGIFWFSNTSRLNIDRISYTAKISIPYPNFIPIPFSGKFSPTTHNSTYPHRGYGPPKNPRSETFESYSNMMLGSFEGRGSVPPPPSFFSIFFHPFLPPPPLPPFPFRSYFQAPDILPLACPSPYKKKDYQCRKLHPVLVAWIKDIRKKYFSVREWETLKTIYKGDGGGGVDQMVKISMAAPLYWMRAHVVSSPMRHPFYLR